MAHMQIIPPLDACVVLEKSNTETRASHLYLAVHALPQEDLYDTDDTGSFALNRGHELHRSIKRWNARDGRPRRLGGVHRGGGT